MRGISAIIAVVLILLITISLAAGAYFFLSMTMSQTTTAAQQGISQTMTQMTKSFTIEAVSGGKIWVRNTGQVPISNLTIYIDGAPANTSNVVIQPGEVGVIQIYDAVDFSRPREIEISGGTTTESKVVAGESLRDPSLVGYWKFDEGTGTTAADSSGNGNDGIINGGAVWVRGKFGNALKFDGSTNYVNCSRTSNLDLTDAVTIEAWIQNITNYGWSQVAGRWHTDSWKEDYALTLRNSGSSWLFQFVITNTSGNLSYVLASATPDFNWHHLAGTFDGRYIKIYFDGQLIGTTDLGFNQKMATSGKELLMGNLWTQKLNGTIDEVRIYNRALSADEIWNHYVHGPI